jgi:hypothetical protein
LKTVKKACITFVVFARRYSYLLRGAIAFPDIKKIKKQIFFQKNDYYFKECFGYGWGKRFKEFEQKKSRELRKRLKQSPLRVFIRLDRNLLLC